MFKAEAILSLRLGRLTSLELTKLTDEHTELATEISTLSQVMEQDSLVYNIMINETLEIKAKHAVPRRSVVWKDEGDLTVEDLITNDR